MLQDPFSLGQRCGVYFICSLAATFEVVLKFLLGRCDEGFRESGFRVDELLGAAGVAVEDPAGI